MLIIIVKKKIRIINNNSNNGNKVDLQMEQRHREKKETDKQA